jgi:PadR family transcriptional regulator PadR
MTKSKTDLLKGTLDMLILKTLASGSMHGYGIARMIEQQTDDALRIEEGSLYPALFRMNRRGLIKSEWGVTETKRRAKFYQLTKKGRKQLDDDESNWQRFAVAVASVLDGNPDLPKASRGESVLDNR